MSTIKIYKVSRDDIMNAIEHEGSFLREVTRYFKLKNPLTSEAVATETAKEAIYQECVKQFNYSEYVRTAEDALRKAKDGSYGKFIREETKKEESKIQAAKAEAERKERLRRYCIENGLNFEEENRKYEKTKSKWDTVGIVGIILAALTLILDMLFLDYEQGTPISIVMWSILGACLVLAVFGFVKSSKVPEFPTRK